MTIKDIKNGNTRTEAMNHPANYFDNCANVAHSELETFARVIDLARMAKANSNSADVYEDAAAEVLNISASILHYASTDEVKTIIAALFDLIK